MPTHQEKPTLPSLPIELIFAICEQAGTEERAKLMSRLARTSKQFNFFLGDDLKELKVLAFLKALSQAVIDDQREVVKTMLDKNPMLLIPHSKPIHFEIESQLTWQRFIAEDPLIMAVKRRQLVMIQLLLPYYNRPELRETKERALNVWKVYETIANAEGEEEIVIPDDYAALMQGLIDVFSQEPCAQGPLKELSVRTERHFNNLFNCLFPKEAYSLSEYIDPELLLLAAWRAYSDNFDAFQNWNQRDAFCVRVIGLIQRAQNPEMADILCDSLYNTAEACRAGRWVPGSAPRTHKLRTGESFYTGSVDLRSGLGFEFFWDGRWGRCRCVGMAPGGPADGASFLELYFKQKTANFWSLCTGRDDKPSTRMIASGIA
jgi:hypothetical protein